MKTVPVTMVMPSIEGFEYTGEYRKAEVGEAALVYGAASQIHQATNNSWPILKQKADWQPLTFALAAELLRERLFVYFKMGGVSCKGRITQLQAYGDDFQVVITNCGYRTILPSFTVDMVSVRAARKENKTSN